MFSNDWIGSDKWRQMKLKGPLPRILTRTWRMGVKDMPYRRTARPGRMQVEADIRPVLWSSNCMPWKRLQWLRERDAKASL